MDKQDDIYPYNGILFYHKRSEVDKCSNMNESWKPYAKWKKPDTKSHISYDSIYMKYPEKANP